MIGFPKVHLDYGCYDGKVINKLNETGVISKGIGVDINNDIIAEHSKDMCNDIKLQAINANERLPFDCNTFDSASILDVIEHVQNQEFILKELRRVIKPNAILIMTVPKKHLFSFLDMGNFKFRFPKIHRMYYIKKHSLEKYNQRYTKCKNGLFGDIDNTKMWHQHFSCKEIETILKKCGFETILFDGMGLFHRPLGLINYFLPIKFGKIFELDSKIFNSANLFCIAKKI